MYGSRSDVVMQFQNPESAILIANWAGMPLSGTVSTTYTTVERSRTEVEPITATQFNVRHDDDEGRLVVGQNGIELFRGERFQIAAGQLASGFPHSCMGGQRSAAHLLARHHDFTAIRHQDADGRLIQRREGDLGDAAAKKRYLRAALA